MTRHDVESDLRTEWARLSESAQAPDLDGLRRRSTERRARRTSAIAGTGAAVLAVAALGVTLNGGLDFGDPNRPTGSTVAESAPASGAEAPGDADPNTARAPSQEDAMPPYAPGDPRQGPAPASPTSALERLQRAEDRLNVPLPQSMPQNSALADAATVAAFADRADQIFVFSEENAMLTYSNPPSHARVQVRDWLKRPATVSAEAPVSLTLTGSQSPVGAPTRLYLAFAENGRSLALYSINGNYAQQLSPTKVSAPGMIRIDELRQHLKG